VRGLAQITSHLQLARKSGSWGTFHSDSALVTRSGHTYIAVALCDDPNGSNWMSDLIVAMDRIIIPEPGRRS
jgi:beta-lactamase class A